MTLSEIQQAANDKYRIEPKDCRLTRDFKRRAKKDYIKKLMKQYGFISETDKVT